MSHPPLLSDLRPTRISTLGRALLLALTLLALGTLRPARADEPAATAPIADLPKLASKGQFDLVLTAIRADKDAADDAQVGDLAKEIQAFDQHAAALAAKRHEAYDKALAKMAQAVQDHKLDEAVVNAVEAHGLADDPAATLERPDVADLIQQAEKTIAAARADNDWLEALNLYRLLDLLYEQSPHYRVQIKECERRVRILRLYAPAELTRLYDQRAQRLAKDKPEPLMLGSETWEQQLAGVEPSMLRTALALAVRRHVYGPNYATLLQGAIDALAVLGKTPALQATFPAFGDPAKVSAFLDGLAEVRKDIDTRKDDLNFLDAGGYLDRLTELNQKTLALPERVMVYEMTDGALATLDDFTNMIWPYETEEFKRTTEGEFFGVGIQISRRDSRLLVVSPLEDTPAQRAGIKPGDIIASVNGQSTTGWSLDQAVRNITGPEGTPVALGIERIGHKDPLIFKLTRAKIVIESVRGWERKPGGGWDYFIDPASHIGYVRLAQFIPQSADELDAAVNQMEQAGGVNALILDLRFDPGGLLKSAVEVSNRFISDGVIVSTVGPDGKPDEQHKARKDKAYPNFPVIVLVNEGSASASEIVSGCLQDYGRALIVGTRSFGKGSVQELVSIGEGKAYFKLTTHHYALPHGRILHRRPDSKTWGVEPDLIVKMTAPQIADAIEFRSDADVLRDPKDPPTTQPTHTAAEILDKGIDPQLETALLVLRTRLVAQHIAVAQKTQPVATP
jgi:carboxyl-terminal processing protease